MKKVLLLSLALIFSLCFLAAPNTAAAATYKNEFAEINADNVAKGYLDIKVTKTTDKELRVRITKGEKTYSYLLKDNKNFYKFPLQMDSGSYNVKILEHSSGNKYAVLYSVDITATITDPLFPFTISHTLVNYDAAPKTVAIAKQLTSGNATDLAKLESVYGNIVETMTYDNALAAKITSGEVTSYIPDVDAVYASHKGICFDYSSVMASMLRSQGIPTRLVMGYVAPSNVYHAWNEVYIANKGWVQVRGSIEIGSNIWSRMDATFAASSANSDLSGFIGNGSNYRTTDIY